MPVYNNNTTGSLKHANPDIVFFFVETGFIGLAIFRTMLHLSSVYVWVGGSGRRSLGHPHMVKHGGLDIPDITQGSLCRFDL